MNETIYPTGQLTVVIRNDAPFVHMQEPCRHRTVKITLTPKQRKQIALGSIGSINGNAQFEEISQVILEPGLSDVTP